MRDLVHYRARHCKFHGFPLLSSVASLKQWLATRHSGRDMQLAAPLTFCTETAQSVRIIDTTLHHSLRSQRTPTPLPPHTDQLLVCLMNITRSGSLSLSLSRWLSFSGWLSHCLAGSLSHCLSHCLAGSLSLVDFSYSFSILSLVDSLCHRLSLTWLCHSRLQRKAT